jgi:hypothetical protein
MKDLPSTAKTVRVSIPASVANDLGAVKKSVHAVLERIGCPACCSGHDIHLEIQREITLGKGFAEVSRAAAFGASRGAQAVSVGVRPGAVQDLGGVEAMFDKLADLTGHQACISGYDFRVQMEEMFIFDRNLAMDVPAMRFG